MSSVSRDAGKSCTKCGRCLPLSAYYVKDKASGRLFARCKDCHNADTLARYNAQTGRPAGVDRRRLKDTPQTEKTCVLCGVIKPADAFSVRSDLPTRLRPVCNDCRRRESRIYKAANPERVRQSNARYRTETRDAFLDRCRQWRKDHPERASAISKRSKAKHADHKRIYDRAWRRANKARASLHYHRRRARLLGNGGSHTVAEWEAIKARQDGCCLACGRREPVITLTKDHIIPVTRGGTDNADNLQGLCLPCNARKGQRIRDLRH